MCLFNKKCIQTVHSFILSELWVKGRARARGAVAKGGKREGEKKFYKVYLDTVSAPHPHIAIRCGCFGAWIQDTFIKHESILFDPFG